MMFTAATEEEQKEWVELLSLYHEKTKNSLKSYKEAEKSEKKRSSFQLMWKGAEGED